MIKKEKGIALISLVVVIAVMTIVASTVVYISLDRFEINSLRKMFNDIELLDDKVSNYYLRYGVLPVLRDNTNTRMQYPIEKINFTRNNQDNGIYFILDLEAMEGISLNYGKEGFEEAKSIKGGNITSKDVYIINAQSHIIYYVKGMQLNGVTYYTLINIENLTNDAIPPSSPQINIISGIKAEDEEGNIYYTTEVEIEIIPGKDKWSQVKNTTYSINGSAEIDITTLTNNIYKLVEEGTYTIVAKTYDNEGNYSQSSVDIVILIEQHS